MGRKKGYDNRKIVKIIEVLVGNPDGIWLRKLAKEAGMHPLTVSKYLEEVLRPIIDEVSLEGGSKPIIRVIKLKVFVLERLNAGEGVYEIMKKLDLINKI